ncbi:MAG: hypothetical protein AAB332_07195 [Planctomycetota bacterium]
MITNHLLKAKYEIQKQLDEEASHDIEKYVKNSHRIVIEVEKQYGLQFKYGDIQSEGVEPFA